MSLRVREWINFVGLSGIHAGALAAFLPGTFHWSALVVAAVLMYVTGGLGITLCYHRTLTHRVLRLFKPFEYVFAVFGALALQGDPIRCVATHRKHHAHSDAQGDPHRCDRGFRWAHVRWLYRPNDAMPTEEQLLRFAPDLHGNRFYRTLRYIHLLLQFALAGGLFVLGVVVGDLGYFCASSRELSCNMASQQFGAFSGLSHVSYGRSLDKLPRNIQVS